MRTWLSTVTLMMPVYAAALIVLFALLLQVSPQWAAGVFRAAFGVDLYHPLPPADLADWAAPALGLLGWAALSGLLAALGLALYALAPRVCQRLRWCVRLAPAALTANRPAPADGSGTG